MSWTSMLVDVKAYMKTCIMVVIVMGIGFLHTGCYVLSQSGTFLKDRFAAVPVERLLEDEHTNPQTRAFLEEVQSVTSFATSSLGLNTSKNYTTYRELDREHLAYIVYAAQEFSFEQKMWSFPITGSLPYKGYFSLADARKEQLILDEDGYDTWVSVVDGFSSLGFFTDPLYSFMKDYSQQRVAELIIHELTHATIWVKDDISFNEQIAEFIAEEGSRRYIEAVHGNGSEAADAGERQKEDTEQLYSDISGLKESLSSLYERTDLNDERKREEKTTVIQSFQKRFSEDYDQDYLTDRYRYIAEVPINNAYLALFGVYHDTPQLFTDLLDYCEGDLKKMISLIAAYSDEYKDPKGALGQLLEDRSS